MIYDAVENAGLYCAHDPRLKKGLDFLASCMESRPEPGRYEIDGQDVYANVMKCTTALPTEVAWEAHREYIDIQATLEGNQLIGFGLLEDLTDPTDYDPDKECLLASGIRNGSYATLCPGRFAILFPQDAHQPNVAAGEASENLKVVVKVRCK